jgi:YD repeat-containing protein
MKTLLSLLLILVSNLVISQTSNDDGLLKYPLKSIHTYCQKDSTKVIAEQRLTYDKENRLIKSTYSQDTIEINYTVFNYNEFGLLISKEFHSLIPNEKLDRIRVFKYNESNKLIFEGFDDERGNNTKNTYLFNETGLLVKSTVDCNYTHWEYTYEYDNKGRLIEKIKNNDLEISYEYSENKLSKEIKHYRNNDNEILYEYDQNNFLFIKKENGKLVEKNIYDDNYLIKRWTYYFGIDPCHSQCCSQYIKTFEYY